jgi:hypothetical protein
MLFESPVISLSLSQSHSVLFFASVIFVIAGITVCPDGVTVVSLENQAGRGAVSADAFSALMANHGDRTQMAAFKVFLFQFQLILIRSCRSGVRVAPQFPGIVDESGLSV